MSQRVLIILASGGRVLLNVVTKGMQFSVFFGFSFKVSSLEIEIGFSCLAMGLASGDILVLRTAVLIFVLLSSLSSVQILLNLIASE